MVPPRDPGRADPADIEEALSLLDDQEDTPAPRPEAGSGIGVARGRSYGTEAGRIHGGREDRLFLGGVGYPYLADLAVGTLVAHRTAEAEPDDLAVADLSHTPVASVQTLAEGQHEAVLLVGAEKRGAEINDGEPSEDPGRVHTYELGDLAPLSSEEATRLIGQGAMGLITVENVLQVGRALDHLPEDTTAITVEPAYDSWGREVGDLSDPVAEALEEVLGKVEAWALDRSGSRLDLADPG